MRRICSFHGSHFFLCCNLILDFFRIVFAPIRRRIELAQRLDVKQATVSAVISRSSFPTLERIATALEVEPWQLLAPPSVVEELKQARAQRSGGGVVAWWLGGCRLWDLHRRHRAAAPRNRGASGAWRRSKEVKAKKSRQGANLVGNGAPQPYGDLCSNTDKYKNWGLIHSILIIF